MHYKHNIHNKNQTSTIHTQMHLTQHVALPGYTPTGMQQSYNYIQNMI